MCSATLGPGAINLLLGTADATTNSSPVVAVSAQVGLNRIYKESHQSVDLVSMFSPVTKWADVVLTPGAVPEMVRKAFKLAQTERPGAVYLAGPEDVEAMAAPPGLGRGQEGNGQPADDRGLHPVNGAPERVAVRPQPTNRPRGPHKYCQPPFHPGFHLHYQGPACRARSP